MQKSERGKLLIYRVENISMTTSNVLQKCAMETFLRLLAGMNIVERQENVHEDTFMQFLKSGFNNTILVRAERIQLTRKRLFKGNHCIFK